MLQRVIAIIVLWLAVNVQLVAALGHACNMADPAMSSPAAHDTRLHADPAIAATQADHDAGNCCIQGTCQDNCAGAHCHFAAALLPAPLAAATGLPDAANTPMTLQLLSPLAQPEQPPIIL